MSQVARTSEEQCSQFLDTNLGKALLLAVCFLGLGLLGLVDYVTGYELGFFVFYSVPVGLAAWYLGRWPAVAVALGATVTWLLADYYSGAKYTARFYYYWNSTVHFLAFVINAITIAKIKSDLDRRHAMAAELNAAREALRTLAELLPSCPLCGKAHQRPEVGSAETAARVTSLRPAVDAALCRECRADASASPSAG